MDQRDRLFLQLSDQVGATARPGTDGAIDVYVGAMAIVRSSSVEELAVEVTADAATGAPPVDVVWKDDRLDATAGGRSKALIATHTVITPDQRDAIDRVADELRAVVNGVHTAVYAE